MEVLIYFCMVMEVMEASMQPTFFYFKIFSDSIEILFGQLVILEVALRGVFIGGGKVKFLKKKYTFSDFIKLCKVFN